MNRAVECPRAVYQRVQDGTQHGMNTLRDGMRRDRDLRAPFGHMGAVAFECVGRFAPVSSGGSSDESIEMRRSSDVVARTNPRHDVVDFNILIDRVSLL